MVSWILIGFVVLILAIIFIKFEHHTKRLKLILIIVLIAFIYFSASSVLHNSGVKVNSLEGAGKATSLYFSWLGNAATNVWHSGGEVKTIVGNAIKGNQTR